MSSLPVTRRWKHTGDRKQTPSYLVAFGGIRHPRQLPSGAMMKTIHPVGILSYYDGVQVFEARDLIGGYYVGMIVDTIAGSDRYLVTGARPERLRQFRTGTLDLRTLLLEAPGGEWYLTLTKSDPGETLTLEPQAGHLAETGFLPEAGYLLDDTPIDDLALEEAISRNNVVFEFSIAPLEAAMGHRVGMTMLGSLLLRVQLTLKYAYHAALRDLPNSNRNQIDTANGHLMDVVVPAAPGSFRMVLEAAKPSDMFGYGELVRGMRRMDVLFNSVQDLDTARAQLMTHRGHLAGSFIKLIQILSDNHTGLSYSWAEPSLTSAQHNGISGETAKELANSLSGFTDLHTETVTLTGEFEKVNRTRGDWGLLTDEGVRTGTISEKGPSLNGLEVGKRYRFECLEDIEIDATGKEHSILYLQEIIEE